MTEFGLTIVQFSPHAWGWTIGKSIVFARWKVFPTRVGVDR